MSSPHPNRSRSRSRRGVGRDEKTNKKRQPSKSKSKAAPESIVGPPPSIQQQSHRKKGQGAMKRIGRAASTRRRQTRSNATAAPKSSRPASGRSTSRNHRKNPSTDDHETQAAMTQANEAAAIGLRHRQNQEEIEKEKQRQFLIDEEKRKVKGTY
jgi:hypothetical protein